MQEKEFNLLHEPWILVLTQEGETKEESLLSVLEHAHELHCISGELPTQDVAILRLLLAVLYATFTRVDVEGNRGKITNAAQALERWQSLWKLKKLPIEPIKDRLSLYEERFYLFHPERPFYQVAGLHEAKGKYNTIAQIISDVPSRVERRFLSMKSGNEAEMLSFSEATRWLISLQAWDYAGKKAAVVNGNKDGGGTGWLGKIGVVYPASQTLFYTLMLNFVMLKSDGNLLPYGSPSWEDNNPPMPGKVERIPAGYCDLLTWQSRRVRLFEDENSNTVKGVLYSYGDIFDKNDMLIEQMSGWHLSTQGDSKGHFIPNKHQKERGMWRDLDAILPQASNSTDINNHSPGVIQWLALLKERDLILDEMIQLCAMGFHYGAMDAKIEAMTADMLSIHTEVLTQLGTDWVIRITNILQLTENCIKQLSLLASDLARACGDSDSQQHKAGEGSGNAAKAEAYFQMDLPFRKWLADINPTQSDPDKVELVWIETVKQILMQLGEEMVHRSGEKGITGRVVNKRLYTAPSALLKFRSNVIRTLEKGG
ncbi:MAG TPA: type I-E CRISPR-associated protein Cse1/CasA [Clostridiales bacterium]|nr:type I-E CRISPR-associated protein Cse1/CasA [Clostridiales bacterium]